MEYQETPPPAGLSDIVRCFWSLTGEANPSLTADPAFPDGSPELIVSFSDPFEQHIPGRRPRRQPHCFLVGQITRPMIVRPTGRIHLIAVRFEAHGAFPLHRPMRTITDRWVPVTRLGGESIAALRRGLGAAPAVPTGIARIAAALERARLAAPSPDPRVAAAVTRIRSLHGAVSAEALARAAGLTVRSLQRLFAEQVGITPKLLARIVRFQRVFTAYRSTPASLSRVAAECGYFDQSHLVRDFRDFAGDAPARLLESVPEFTAFFTALARPSSA